MKGLFDTGAEVTLADVSITDSERWIPAPYVNIPVTLDGTPLKIKGAVRATFEFQGVSVHDHLIYLVEGLGVSCLLGTDVMSRFPNGFILDFSRRSVTLAQPTSEGDAVKFSHPDHQLPQLKGSARAVVGRVRLRDTVTVPAGHEAVLRASVDPSVA